VPLVLGVDSSTRSTKVEVRDADTGALVATGGAPHPAVSPPRSEQDPAAWWNALVAAIATAGVHDVAAMSVAGQQHGLVAVDGAGAVLRPAKLWNDTESAPEAAELVRRLGAERWARATGVVPVASITVTKVQWLADHEPEVLDRAAKLLLPHDWLTYRLTGRFVTDRGDASGTGYWSPFVERWRTDVLRAVDNHRSETEWAERLPDVLGPSDTADWVAATVHEQLGLRGRPLVAAGTGDNLAAALGVGLRPGRGAVSIGTSGTAYAVSPTPAADPTGAVAGFADATGRFLPLVCTMNAALVTNAFARLLGVDLDELGRLALAAPPGANGVVLVPYLDGERTPNRPEATGTLTGFRSGVSREEIARAAFEGVVCGLLEGLDALTAAGVDVAGGPLTLVGGGARSAAYRRILADLAGRTVCVPGGEEHVATGACVQAAAVLHDQPPEDVAAAWGLGTGDLVEPDEAVDRQSIRAAYAKARS
jgi:xylulokinase